MIALLPIIRLDAPTLGAAHAPSPRRNVVVFAVPVPRREEATVPDDKLLAFNVVNPEPLPVITPAALMLTNAVALEFCASNKLADCDAAPRMIKPLFAALSVQTPNCDPGDVVAMPNPPAK